MIDEPLTLYKLMVLYMLNRVDFPLTKAQLQDFLLEREYTNFITLQQAIGELTDTSMIKTETIRNRTLLTLTPDGSKTISYFGNRIGESLRNEIDEYFRQNALKLRNQLAITANYYKATTGEYEAHLVARDKDVKLVDITLSVPAEETAAVVCENWQKRNQEIYQYLIKALF